MVYLNEFIEDEIIDNMKQLYYDELKSYPIGESPYIDFNDFISFCGEYTSDGELYGINLNKVKHPIMKRMDSSKKGKKEKKIEVESSTLGDGTLFF